MKGLPCYIRSDNGAEITVGQTSVSKVNGKENRWLK